MLEAPISGIENSDETELEAYWIDLVILPKMALLKEIFWVLLPAFAQAATVNYAIPSTAAASAAKLAPAPVGLS